MAIYFFFFQAEDGIRDRTVTGVQTCALPISLAPAWQRASPRFPPAGHPNAAAASGTRSEERRVGKECRSRWLPDHEKKKKKVRRRVVAMICRAVSVRYR